MSKHHFSLWCLLALAFVIFTVASAIELPEICGYKPKSSGIADSLFATHVITPMLHSEAQDSSSTEERDKFPVPMDTTAKTILFIGDSMLEGLGPRLAAYAAHNGHTLYNVIWYSSTTEVWGRSDKLTGYIARINPDYIFICLGANELFVSDIASKRRQYVEKMVREIGDIPFLWIGPPNWREDTGINTLIESNVPEGSFFMSNGMHFERSADGAHPTRSSAALWMDSVARWMPMHSSHPIRMENPGTRTARPARIFVHQPNEQ